MQVQVISQNILIWDKTAGLRSHDTAQWQSITPGSGEWSQGEHEADSLQGLSQSPGHHPDSSSAPSQANI